jgi:glycosyltransferase involved in cell wall biosynthesis
MAEVVPDAELTLIGYPVDPPPPVLRAPTPGPPTLLFAGSARPEKGLETLLIAMSLTTEELRVRVVGRQDPTIRAGLEKLANGRVTWVDDYVPAEDLAAAYQSATLAVVPYTKWFGRHGGASGILLGALAFATPAVVSASIASQLPDGYRGAIVVEPESPEALAEGIDGALKSIDALTEGASAQGPEFIREHHSFPGYARELVGAVTTAQQV